MKTTKEILKETITNLTNQLPVGNKDVDFYIKGNISGLEFAIKLLNVDKNLFDKVEELGGE